MFMSFIKNFIVGLVTLVIGFMMVGAPPVLLVISIFEEVPFISTVLRVIALILLGGELLICISEAYNDAMEEYESEKIMNETLKDSQKAEESK